MFNRFVVALMALIRKVSKKIGDLSDLQTTEKDNLVSAINEVAQGGGGGGSSTLDGLSDTNITSPQNGQVLGYNSTNEKWENVDVSGSDLPPYSDSDINKVLTVSESQETITVVQEQTVAYEGSNKDGDYGYLAEGTYDISGLEDGDNVTVIIDGVSHDGYVDSGLAPDIIYIRNNNDDPYYFRIEFRSGQDPEFIADPIPSFPHTVSCIKVSSEPTTELAWKPSVPPFTDSDVGKVLTIEDVTTSITVVQEQTFQQADGSNRDGDYVFLNDGTFDFSLVNNGDVVTLMIDGVSYPSIVSKDGNYFYTDEIEPSEYGGRITANDFHDFEPYFECSLDTPFPHTISLTKPQTETITAVQEQTVTTEDYYVEAWGATGPTAILPQGTYDKTLLNVGDGVTFTVNGVAYSTVVEEHGDGIIIGAENFALFFNTNYFDGADAFCVNGEESGSSYTISVSKTVTPTSTPILIWKRVSGGGVIETTYAELKSARDNGNLQPGSFYRITDYETIINGTYDLSELAQQPTYVHYARSAGHAFDLIVMAIDESTLDEHAVATQHDGDTYFANSALEQWDVKYTLDNDPTKYSWADATNGKGVITYLKDEFSNEAYYDFKNVQILAYALTMANQSATPDKVCYNEAGTGDAYQPNRYGCAYKVASALETYMQSGVYESPYGIYDFSCSSAILTSVGYSEVDQTYLTLFNADWYYTFDYYSNGNHQDFSVIQHEDSEGCEFNSIGKCHDYLYLHLGIENDYPPLGLNGNVFEVFDGGKFPPACNGNKLDIECVYNLFGGNDSANKLAESCVGNILCDTCNNNRLGWGVKDCVLLSNCGNNLFGPYCYSIHLGKANSQNTFGVSCSGISTGYWCNGNTFGDHCERNTFGDNCERNTLGCDCTDNIFANSCSDNIFGAECSSNSFGDTNSGVLFGAKCTGNTLGVECYGCVFGYGCDNNTLAASCHSNIFGDGCDSNDFGGGSYGNILGNFCGSNTLGASCQNNMFETGCSHNNISGTCSNNRMGATFSFNTIGLSCSGNTFGNRFLNNTVCAHTVSCTFGINISYINVVVDGVGALSSAEYYHICDGVMGTNETPLSITVSASRAYETWVGYNSSGVLKEWCPADLAP